MLIVIPNANQALPLLTQPALVQAGLSAFGALAEGASPSCRRYSLTIDSGMKKTYY